MLSFTISLGKIYGILLGYIFLRDDLSHSDWKTMMLCGNIPSVIVLVGIFFI